METAVTRLKKLGDYLKKNNIPAMVYPLYKEDKDEINGWVIQTAKYKFKALFQTYTIKIEEIA